MTLSDPFKQQPWDSCKGGYSVRLLFRAQGLGFYALELIVTVHVMHFSILTNSIMQKQNISTGYEGNLHLDFFKLSFDGLNFFFFLFFCLSFLICRPFLLHRNVNRKGTGVLSSPATPLSPSSRQPLWEYFFPFSSPRGPNFFLKKILFLNSNINKF